MRDSNIKYSKRSMYSYKEGKEVDDLQSELSKNSLQNVQPIMRDIFRCTIMVLENLAVPGWISVSCNYAVISEIICVTENTIAYEELNIAKTKEIQVVNLTLFLCPSGQSISSSRQCNGVNDCFDNADEINCFCFVKGRKEENSYYCKYLCQHPTCICHKLLFQGNYPGYHLFKQDKKGYFDTNITSIKDIQYFRCLDELNIDHEEKLNGQISVCHLNNDEIMFILCPHRKILVFHLNYQMNKAIAINHHSLFSSNASIK